MTTQLYQYLITLLMSLLTIMSAICMFWLKHYIANNDREHRKLFNLIDEIKNQLIRGKSNV